jgi:hypothetical protein
MSQSRKKIWIDAFQTKLCLRIGAYLAVYVICLCNILFAWRLIWEGPGNPLQQYFAMLVDYAPVFLSLAVLLPVMAFDAMRFSHRIVGPLVRVRQTLKALAAGEQVQRVKLREGDFLNDLRDDFNSALETLQKQGVPVLKPSDGPEEGSQRRLA